MATAFKTSVSRALAMQSLNKPDKHIKNNNEPDIAPAHQKPYFRRPAPDIKTFCGHHNNDPQVQLGWLIKHHV